MNQPSGSITHIPDCMYKAEYHRPDAPKLLSHRHMLLVISTLILYFADLHAFSSTYKNISSML
jgi:hypothetical protein